MSFQRSLTLFCQTRYLIHACRAQSRGCSQLFIIFSQENYLEVNITARMELIRTFATFNHSTNPSFLSENSSFLFSRTGNFKEKITHVRQPSKLITMRRKKISRLLKEYILETCIYNYLYDFVWNCTASLFSDVVFSLELVLCYT